MHDIEDSLSHTGLHRGVRNRLQQASLGDAFVFEKAVNRFGLFPAPGGLRNGIGGFGVAGNLGSPELAGDERSVRDREWRHDRDLHEWAPASNRHANLSAPPLSDKWTCQELWVILRQRGG